VASDFVEFAWLGVQYRVALIVFGSKSWSPAFRRLEGDGWQRQRVNRLKAGLQHRRIGLPSHSAEFISGRFLVSHSEAVNFLPVAGFAGIHSLSEV